MANWRPNDWKQPYKFPAEFGNISDYDFAYEHGASNMLEARDRWWIELMDSIISVMPCADMCEDGDMEEISDTCPCTYMQWQLVKKGLEVHNGDKLQIKK